MDKKVYRAIQLRRSNRGFLGRSQTSRSLSPEARRAPCCTLCCDRWERFHQDMQLRLQEVRTGKPKRNKDHNNKDVTNTWSVSSQPLVKYGVSVGVEQDKDGVIGRQVSLATCPIQEQMGQVMEAPHHGVVVSFGGAVACQNNVRSHVEVETKEKLFWLLVTFNGIPETLRRGGVVRRRVERVDL